MNFLSSSKISFPARLPDAHQGHTQFPCQRSSGCYSGHLRGQHGRAPGIHEASGQEGSRLVCLQIRDELKLLSCHFCEGAPVVPSFSWIKLYKLSSRLVHELGIHHMVQKGGRVDHAITGGRCSTFQDTIDHHSIIHTWQRLTVTHHFAV